MRLDATGHPLHTRALSVVFTARADGRLDVEGAVLDLRKRGFVPVAGDLQGSGIIHDMRLAAVVDPATRVLDSIVADQRSVAFEPTALTEGESCRDPIGRVAGLAGTSLDGGWGRRIAAEIGGPRGCSHLLTLFQLLASTVATALERDRLRDVRAWRPGERMFRRDVIVDGHERAAGSVALALQLTDLEHAPAPPVAPSMDRFAAAREVRGVATVDLGRFALTQVTLGERRRTRETLDAAWRDRADVAGPLAGQSVMRGVSAALMASLGDRPDDRPLLDGLLMLAPALIQCVAALSDGWPSLAARGAWIVGMGGQADSCYMWRAGGPLQRARTAEEPRSA